MKASSLPDWVLKARNKWEYRGQKRPPFAIVPKADEISVWDFPRPPKIEPIAKPISVFYNKSLIAKTSNGVSVLETANPPTYYIPPEDIDFTQLLLHGVNGKAKHDIGRLKKSRIN